MIPFRYALAALLTLLPLAGCSLVGDEGGTTADGLADARIARQEGRIDRAVELLRQAQRGAPENGEVRLELAAALLDQVGVTVFDLQAAFEHLGGALAAARGGARHRVACSASGAGGTEVPFDPAGAEFNATYTRLAARAPVLDEARRLAASVLPDALYTLALSGYVVPDGQGGYTLSDYGAEALLAEVRAAVEAAYADADAGDVDQALLTFAAAQFFSSYFGLFPDPLPAGVTGFYRVGAAGEAAVLRVCAVDAAALNAYQAASLAPLVGSGAVVVALDLRLRHHAGSASAELLREYVDEGVTVFRALYEGFRAD